jgi:hypothetical protein
MVMTPIIPELRRLRQEDGKLEAKLQYIASLSQKIFFFNGYSTILECECHILHGFSVAGEVHRK